MLFMGVFYTYIFMRLDAHVMFTVQQQQQQISSNVFICTQHFTDDCFHNQPQVAAQFLGFL